MFSRTPFLGLCTMALVTVPTTRLSQSSYALAATGSIEITAEGSDARYGLVTPGVDGRPFFSLTLGAAQHQSVLVLSRVDADLPEPGRYPVRGWEERVPNGESYQALFVAGTVASPLGVFHGRSGSVTISRTGPRAISGEFEVHARGFLASSPDDEDQWVTVRGSFVAIADSSWTTIRSVTVHGSR
jgi:hypothetical protein